MTLQGSGEDDTGMNYSSYPTDQRVLTRLDRGGHGTTLVDGRAHCQGDGLSGSVGQVKVLTRVSGTHECRAEGSGTQIEAGRVSRYSTTLHANGSETVVRAGSWGDRKSTRLNSSH